MHYGMMACCAVMLLPVAVFFLAGGSIAGLWSNVALFAPIALCVGVHVLMFKMMGKSCNGAKSETASDVTVETEPIKIPVIARNLSA
jgi:hypothetical protein